MMRVTAATLAARRLWARPSGRIWPWLSGVVLASLALASVLYQGVARAEPLFTAVNVATMVTVVTLGAYLVLRQGEVFSGLCFVVAGITWSSAVIDVAVPTWGPYAQWTFAGTTYTAMGWATLRYRRRRLLPQQKAFVVMSVFLTVGISAVSALFIPPAVLGYPADTPWPLLADGGAVVVPVILAANTLSFLVLGIYFTVLMVRVVRSAPLMLRTSVRPMAFFGASMAVSSAVIETAAMLDPLHVTVHLASTAVGAFMLALSGALTASMVLQQVVSSRFVTQLPVIRTPETVAAYLQTVTGDASAELLYWLPASNRLTDAEAGRGPRNGRRRDRTAAARGSSGVTASGWRCSTVTHRWARTRWCSSSSPGCFRSSPRTRA